jgi:hypothetical protein
LRRKERVEIVRLHRRGRRSRETIETIVVVVVVVVVVNLASSSSSSSSAAEEFIGTTTEKRISVSYLSCSFASSSARVSYLWKTDCPLSYHRCVYRHHRHHHRPGEARSSYILLLLPRVLSFIFLTFLGGYIFCLEKTRKSEEVDIMDMVEKENAKKK